MKLTEILIKPILTEKANGQQEKLRRYAFKVNRRANKLEIKSAIEQFYGVNVVDINTLVVPGKFKTRSTKAGIISGLSSDDRNTIGVYPMKGKILNVRGESVKRIAENKEISEIKKILGLETGKVYKNIDDIHKNLRYGKVLFMTDQDDDGSHIKGLGINLFQCEWPSLLKIPGFIGFMNTPILKAKKKTEELLFYNDGEYEAWKETNQIGRAHV